MDNREGASNLELGDTVVDYVTGFKGVITGVATYITGCVQFSVQPSSLDKDGNIRDAVWLDEGRLELAQEARLEAPPEDAAAGGPVANPAPTK